MPTCWFFMVAQQNLFLVFSFFTFSVSHVQWFRAPTTRTLHAVGLLSKLYWSWFLFFYLHFLKEDSHYWYLKLSTPMVWILVSLVNWLIVETRWSVWPLKRILRQPVTLKLLLHNTSGNRETKGYHSNWETLIQIAHWQSTVIRILFISILSKAQTHTNILVFFVCTGYSCRGESLPKFLPFSSF